MGIWQIWTIVFLVLLLSGAGLLVYLGVKKDRRENNFETSEKNDWLEKEETAQNWVIDEYINLFEITFEKIKNVHNKTSDLRVADINKEVLTKILFLESQENFEIAKLMKKSKIDFDFIEKLKKNNASSWKSKFSKEIEKFIKLKK